MTTILQQLRDERTARIEAEAQAAAERKERQQAETAAIFRANVLDQPVPASLLDELQAEFVHDPNDNRPALILHYRNYEMKEVFSKNVTVAKIVNWTDKVDHQITDTQRHREAKRATFTDAIPQADSLRALRQLRTAVESYNLTNDLTQALDAREAELQAAYDAEITEAIAQVEAATCYTDLDQFRWDHPTEPRVTAAIEAAEARIQQAATERAERRAQAERDAFYPYRVWQLEYGVIATGENGETPVDVNSIYVTSPVPDGSSLYTKCGGGQVYIYNPICAELVDITEPEHMRRYNSQQSKTEWGDIHIPPANCERL